MTRTLFISTLLATGFSTLRCIFNKAATRMVLLLFFQTTGFSASQHKENFSSSWEGLGGNFQVIKEVLIEQSPIGGDVHCSLLLLLDSEKWYTDITFTKEKMIGTPFLSTILATGFSNAHYVFKKSTLQMVLLLFLQATGFSATHHRKGFVSPWEGLDGNFPVVKVVQVIKEVLLEPSSSQGDAHCSLLLFLDGEKWFTDITRHLGESSGSWSMANFVIPTIVHHSNFSAVSPIDDLIIKGRKVRKLGWCSRIIVMIRDVDHLATFVESSRKHRLVSWPIQLLVITSLSYSSLLRIMQDSWTLSMMNAMLINFEDPGRPVGIYTLLPYTPEGPTLIRSASWIDGEEIIYHSDDILFLEKYSNFYGSEFKATGLTWEPNWKQWEEDGPNDTKIKKYSGSEYLLLVTLSEALNFTINFIHSPSWKQAQNLVAEGEIDILSVYHLILPKRLERFDFTYSFEYSFTSFGMRKPELKPQWQSLRYPFQESLWLALIATIASMPVVMLLVVNFHMKTKIRSNRFWTVALEVMRTLLSQDISPWVPSGHSLRVLLAAWLFFAFLVSTAYRGNLTAALTLPRYPPRVETIEDLVNTVDRTTMQGAAIKNVFKGLSSPVSQKFSNLIIPGVKVVSGLQMASIKNQAHMASRRHLQFLLAKHFTEADGSSKMYIGRETVVPGLAGWPIPHDAPYKQHFDRIIMAIIEAGLFEKWNEDFMARTVSDSRLQKQEELKLQPHLKEEQLGKSTGRKSLTIVHMQGPLMIFGIGIFIAILVIIQEVIVVAILCHKDGGHNVVRFDKRRKA